MQLGLVEENPPSGAPAATLERRAELFPERRRRGGVRQRGSRVEVQLAVDDLGLHVARRRQDVFIGNAPARRIGHRMEV